VADTDTENRPRPAGLNVAEWARQLPFQVGSPERFWRWLRERDCRLTLAEAAALLGLSEAGVREAAKRRGWITSDPAMTWGNAHAVLLTAARVQELADQRATRPTVSAAPERGVSKSLAARMLGISRTRAIQLLAAGRLTHVPVDDPLAPVDPISLLVEATRRVLTAPTGSETAAHDDLVSARRG